MQTIIETTKAGVIADDSKKFEYSLTPLEGYPGWLGVKLYVNGVERGVFMRFRHDQNKTQIERFNVGGWSDDIRLNEALQVFDLATD